MNYLFVAAILTLLAGTVEAGPLGGQVVAGAGTITLSGTTTTIAQSGQSLSVNWTSFNIAPQETVAFVQPSITAIAVNRILDLNGTQILGHLNANGQVFLINPNGIVFGPGAQVNVGGLVASTLDLHDPAGDDVKYFSGAGSGSIINDGNINASGGGYVALLGNTVSNHGVITAQLGSVALGAGSGATLTFAGNRLVHMQVDPGVLNTLADNSGLIRANGGQIFMTAGTRDALLASVVNNTGVIEANTVDDRGGVIVLAGTVDVSSATGAGGQIVATGDSVLVGDDARLLATGATGGGTIAIGGGWQGGGDIAQAMAVYVSNTALLDASATGSGNGGEITVRSDVNKADSATRVFGALRARGGAGGGSGGRIETSGHYLDVSGIAIDASTTSGRAGEWLLDPYNVIIGSTTSGNSYSPPNFSPGTSDSTILASAISTALTGGNSVTITTGSAGSSLGDITVNSAIAKTAGAATTLTLQAADSIIVNQPITNTSATGALNVSLLADSNNGTHDGVGVVILNNSITTAGGAIAFGNGATQAINGVTTLVGGDVYVGGSSAVTLNTAGGQVDVFGQLIIANPAGFNVNTANGNVNFSGLVDSGDSYGFVTSANVSWTSALSAAKSGLGANVDDTYLATITSRLENAVAGAAANYVASWLGAQRVTGIGTDAIWRWVAGPEGLQNNSQGLKFFTQNGSASANGSGGAAIGSAYVNWNSGEPNNFNGANLTASGFGEGVMQFVGTQGQWNDLAPGNTLSGYVRETNLAPSPLSVSAGTGVVTFSQALGSNKPLASLAVTARTIALSSNTVNTTGGQTFTGQVTVGGSNVNLLTVSANNLTTTFGGGVPALSASYSGFVNGNTVASLTTAATVTTTATAQPNAGSYPITAAGVVDSNYYIIYNPGTLIVNLAPLTVTASSAAKLYGAAIPALTVSYGGFVYSDTASIITTAAQAATVATSSSNVGTYATTASGAVISSANYVIGYTNGTLTVNPAPLTLSGLSGTARNYNGTTIDALSGTAVLSGLIGGQTLTLGNATNGTLASANVGTQAVGTAITLINGTGLASNYTLTQPTLASVTISQAPLTVTGLSGTSRAYNGLTADALSGAATLSGLQNGETLTLGNATTGTLANANVGTRAVSTAITLTNATGLASNYLLTQPTLASVTISQAPLTVTGLSGTSRTYNGSTVDILSGTAVLTGLQNSEVLTLGNTSSGTLASANAGTQAVGTAITLISGTGLESNYSLAQPTLANVTISQAPLTISGLSGTARNYNGLTADALSGTASLSGLQNGETLTLGNASSGTLASANAGIQAVGTAITLISGTGLASNYLLTQPTLTNVTIAQTPLTVSGLSGTNRAYDGSTVDILSGTALLSGLQNGETLTLGNATTGTLTSPNAGSQALSTAIILVNGTGLAGNYSLAQPTLASVNISQALLTVSGTTTGGKVYDGSTIATLTNGTLNGVIPGDTVALTQAGTFASKNIGTGVAITAFDTLSGAAANNYALTQPTNLAATITVRGLGLTLSGNPTRVYDGTASFGFTGYAASLSGILAGDAVSVASGSVTGYGDKNVGTNKAVTFAGFALSGLDAGNYQLISGTATSTASITAAPISAVLGVAANNKVYDGGVGATLNAGSATFIGRIGSDNLSVAAGTGMFADRNVATGISVAISGIALGGTDAGNYILGNTGASTTATITQLASVTWVGPAMGGSWSNPANWAGGAIPDLSNVANVIVPANDQVRFDSGVSGPVNLNSLGGGGLIVDGGTLNVATAINLATFAQDGGTLGGTGSFTVTDAFMQTAGQIAMNGGAVNITQALGNLSYTSIAGGSLTLNAPTGAVQLGNLAVSGNLVATTGRGSITQSGGSTVTIDGATALTAGNGALPADISLDNSGNLLRGAVGASGAQVSLAGAGPLTLGTIATSGNLLLGSNGALNLGTSTVGGNLAANSGNGNITQDGPLFVTGTTTLAAGTGTIQLDNPGNVLLANVATSGSVVGIVGKRFDFSLNASLVNAVSQLQSSFLVADDEGSNDVNLHLGATGPSLRIVNGGIRLPAR